MRSARSRFGRVKLVKPEASRLSQPGDVFAGHAVSLGVGSFAIASAARAIKGRKPLNDLTKNILLWVVIVLVLLLVFSRYMPAVGQPQEIRVFDRSWMT